MLNKTLVRIVDYVVRHASEKYYMAHALVADAVDGPIFASLLIGPCALEFTQVKSGDYVWSDPNADELVQRQRMRGGVGHTSLAHRCGGGGVGVNEIGAIVVASASASGGAGAGTGAGTGGNHHTQNHLPHQHSYQHHHHQPSHHHHHHHLHHHDNKSGAKIIGMNTTLLAKRKVSLNALEDLSNNFLMQQQQQQQQQSQHLTADKKRSGDHKDSAISPTSKNNVSNNGKWGGGGGGGGGNSPLHSPVSNATSSPMSMQQHTHNAPTPAQAGVTTANTAREYVESLHQNSKSQIVYAKNNVIVKQKESHLAGYLSLHMNAHGLILKWTPNELMNGPGSPPSAHTTTTTTTATDESSSSSSPSQSQVLRSKG